MMTISGINGGSGDQDQSQELSSIPTEDHDFPEDPALSLSEEEIDDEKGKTFWIRFIPLKNEDQQNPL
ncbi:MAG: hypothetical protein H6631_13780 [Anaerolineaceae bacterium]|nr:hypothetical protein [Anaerolineaceae bacterium]